METENHTPLLKPALYTAATVICIIIMTFAGCSMHSNTYDGERLKGEAEIQRAVTERAKAEAEARKEETLAIERLVGTGINPVAARCAVKGWSSQDREACVLAGARENAY
jgi:hypothetical protein